MHATSVNIDSIRAVRDFQISACRSLPGPQTVRSRIYRFTARSQLSKRGLLLIMAAKPVFEAWVKGDPKKEVLGDCEPLHTTLKSAITDKDILSIPHGEFQIHPAQLVSDSMLAFQSCRV